MAGPVYVQIRLWNIGKSNIHGDASNVLNELKRKMADGSAPTMYEIMWKGTPQAGAEELGTAADAAKDGTTAPFQISVVSASANDTNTAAGHVRKVALIGVTVPNPGVVADQTPKTTVEVINMNGTTDVTSSRYYLRLIHAYACDWGSGGQDAAGDITIESPADTDLQTIKAGNNESNGCILYFHSGARVLFRRAEHHFEADAAVTDGVLLTVLASEFGDSLNSDADLETLVYTLSTEDQSNIIDPVWSFERIATVNSNIKFSEHLIANAVASNLKLLVKVTRN